MDWDQLSLTRNRAQEGFTLLEMVVAVTVLAITLLLLAYGMFGAMNVLQVAKHKTAFLEAANAEVETVRALAYVDVGVNQSDPAYAELYPSGKFSGRDAVLFTSPVAAAPAAKTVVTTSPVVGLVTPYTVLRRVTWTNEDGGAPAAATCLAAPVCLKRIDVEIQYTERGRAQRVSYSSVYYPGNLGPQLAAEPERPVANFTISYTGCEVPTTCPTAYGLASVTNFTFDGSSSTCNSPCTPPLTYYWDFGDGTDPVSGVGLSSVTHTFSRAGIYDVVMEVTNAATPAGTKAMSRSVYIGVNKPPPSTCLVPPPQPASNCNQAPIARFTSSYDPAVSNSAPLIVTVDGSLSSDPDCDTGSPPRCDPLTYSWDWGDCSTPGTGVSPSHRYATPGTYTITLTVRDPAGLTDTTLVGDGATEGASEAILQEPKVLSLSGQTCAIVTSPAPFFKNPSTNTTSNFINIKGNGQLFDGTFYFEALTNQACTSVFYDVPRTTGTLTATLSHSGDVTVPCATGAGNSESRKRWVASVTIATSTTFNSGNQTSTVRASGSVASVTQQVPFSAR